VKGERFDVADYSHREAKARQRTVRLPQEDWRGVLPRTPVGVLYLFAPAAWLGWLLPRLVQAGEATFHGQA
jgi:hypothetical protein